VQIAQDQKSITFTPAAGSTSAQFSYSIADASDESCSTPGWVYVRAPGPNGHFTWDCNGMDCSFRAVLNTMEWIQNFTWRFTCPPGTEATCSNVVKTKWPAGILMRLPQEGVWKVKMEAYYYTGKVVHYEADVPIIAAEQFLKFRRFNEHSDGLDVDLIMTETTYDNPLETLYEIYWGDGTSSGFSHINGIVGAHAQHSYANPGLYRISSYMRKSTGEDGTWVADLEVVNAPPVVKFELTPDPVNPNLIKKSILGTYDDVNPLDKSVIPSWHWDMGDGWSRTYTTPNIDPYTYTKPGTFLVTLKLTDKHGASALATREITIPNKPPTGKFRVECADLKCTLIAFDMVDELGVKSYIWNVGGQSITTTTPSYTHTFATAGRYPVSVTLSDGEKTAQLNRIAEVRATTPNQKLALYMIAPCRGYDAGTNLLGAGVTRAISLATCIPADAVAAEINAVVVNSASAGNLTFWSPAETQPSSTHLNFPAAVNRSNNGAVKVSNQTINARLSMATAGTSARIIVDVVGYYAPERVPGTGEVGPLEWSWDWMPKRLYDSRNPGSTKLASGTLTSASLGEGYVPRAVFANLGIINSSAPGHLNVWATGTSEPVTSVLNFEPGVNLSNGSLIKVAAGTTSANNATIRYGGGPGATSDYTIDLYAQYRDAGPDGARYEAITPCRLLDTRDAAYGEPRLKAGETRAIYAPGNCGIPADLWWGGALRLNFTVVSPTIAGHLKTVPEYAIPPETLLTSRLNFTAGAAIANASVVAINPSKHFQVQSSSDTDLVIDVVGYYRTAPNFYVFDYGLTQSFKMSYNWGADMRSQWDYGDGTVGMVDPSRTRCRTYEQPGTYNVKLIAWNVNDSSTKTVYERSVVVANKTPVALIDASQDRKYVFSVAEASHDEPLPGESVPPIGYGCSNVATYTALNYTWDYGDGTFGSGIESEHTYGKPGTYTMTLTATDRFGAKGTSQATFVIPNDPPTASFVFNCNGLDCDFDGTGSTDDDKVLSYQWTFGAGTTPVTTTVPKTTFHFPATGQYTVSLVTSDGSLSSAIAKRIVTVTSSSPSEKLAFFPIAPCRTFDSRTGSALPGNVMTTIPITTAAGATKCGVPATARAAALNLAVLASTSAGYLTVWNGTGAAPIVSAVVFPAGNTVRASQANVALSAGGTFAVQPGLSGTAPSTHLIVDVYGYFAADTVPAAVARGPYKYQGTAPYRVYDSRPSASLSKGDTRYVQVDRAATGIAEGESALAANLHVIGSVAGGHATLFSSAIGLPPEASTINFAAAGTLTNGVLIELGGRPADDLGLQYVTAVSSTTHVALDAVGTFAAANTLSYQAIAPCRALDTRVADYGVGRLPAGITTPIQIQGNCGVPRGAKAIAVHATVVSPDGDGYLRLDRPDRTLTNHASVLFKATDPSISNALIVELSEQQRDLGITPSIAGSGTGLHLVLDVVGFFKE
jgi:PKD repeat protein